MGEYPATYWALAGGYRGEVRNLDLQATARGGSVVDHLCLGGSSTPNYAL